MNERISIGRLSDARDIESVIALSQSLIRIPSQTGKDSPIGVLNLVRQWCVGHALAFREISSRGKNVGILITIDSGIPGPAVCLNAPIDTAPVGSMDLWSVPPFDGVIRDGWLCGRGSGDAKTGAAIALHAALIATRSKLIANGCLYVLLEADEHTGRFSCIRSIIEREKKQFDFVAILYPGNRAVRIGARGFWRGKLTFSGLMRHSGSSSEDYAESNPILFAASFLEQIRKLTIPGPNIAFPLPPVVTPTMVRGGEGFTHVPATVDLNIDIRTTTDYDAKWARQTLMECLDQTGSNQGSWPKPQLREMGSWPPYLLAESEPFSKILTTSAKDVFDREILRKVSGPSSIGNYLATKGIPATCGFGVTAENIHGIDERINVDTISPILDTYLLAIARWHTAQLSTGQR